MGAIHASRFDTNLGNICQTLPFFSCFTFLLHRFKQKASNAMIVMNMMSKKTGLKPTWFFWAY